MDILGSFRKAKASILHGAGHALRFKGDAYNSFADSLDMFADGVNPRQRPRPARVTFDKLHDLFSFCNQEFPYHITKFLSSKFPKFSSYLKDKSKFSKCPHPMYRFNPFYAYNIIYTNNQ